MRVHRRDHGGEGLAFAVALSLRSIVVFRRALLFEGSGLFIVAVFIEVFSLRLQRTVRGVERQVEEEGFSFGRALDKPDSLIAEQLG